MTAFACRRNRLYTSRTATFASSLTNPYQNYLCRDRIRLAAKPFVHIPYSNFRQFVNKPLPELPMP